MGKSSMGARGGRMRWVVLAVVAALGGVGYMAHQQAKALVARSLNVAFDNGDTDVGRVFFDINGNAVASDVVLYLSNPVLAPTDPYHWQYAAVSIYLPTPPAAQASAGQSAIADLAGQ